MPMDFALPPAQLNGDMDVLVTFDPDQDRNHILEIDRHWYVQPHWYVDGPAATLLGGTWTVMVKVESMGSGYEGTLVTQDFPVNQVGPGPITHVLEYRPWIHIPSRLEDPNHSIPEDGAYKLVVVLTFTNVFNQHARIAGFIEGPLLQFYHFEVPI